MAKMTVTDRLILRDIILDKLEEANEGKMSGKKLDDLAYSQLQELFKADLKDLAGVGKRITELRNKEQRIEDFIKDTINKQLDQSYSYTSFHNEKDNKGKIEKVTIESSEYVEFLKKKLKKKYRLIDIPEKYEIEKEIVKAGNKEYNLIIKELVKRLTK